MNSLTLRSLDRTRWSSAAAGIRVLADGELIVLRHDNRIVLAGCAGSATTEQIAFVIRYSTGFLQIALHEADCDRLLLPESTPTSRTIRAPGYGQCVSVDAATGVSTGISGADRARTARVLADPRSVADDLTRPGHLIPVRVNPDVFGHGLTVGAMALALTDAAQPQFAGAVFADLEGIGDPTDIAGVDDAEALAVRYGLTLVSTADGNHTTV